MSETMKRALVTGGSGSIGSAICKQLASQGYFVYVHANSNLEKAQKTVEQIKIEGGDAQAVCFDVTNVQQVNDQLEAILEQGKIQIIINNAGSNDDVPMAGMSTEQWGRVIDTSLNGFFNVTQPLLLPMMSCRWGRVVSISSVAATLGNRGQSNYAAAKAGLHGASKSLAIELASRGVTVNVVAPGVIESEMTEHVFDKQQIKAMVPMNRAGKATEVASLVGFLCSDDAAYVSGQVIGINGAMA